MGSYLFVPSVIFFVSWENDCWGLKLYKVDFTVVSSAVSSFCTWTNAQLLFCYTNVVFSGLDPKHEQCMMMHGGTLSNTLCSLLTSRVCF